MSLENDQIILDQLPINILLQICRQLTLKEQFRMRAVNKRLRLISSMAIGEMTTIDLWDIWDNDGPFQGIEPESLSILFDLCSKKLERVQLRKPSFALKILARFECPKLRKLFVSIIDGENLFGDLVRRCPKLETIKWYEFDDDRKIPRPNPRGVINRNLQRLHLGFADDAVFEYLTDHCPNLKHLIVKRSREFISSRIFDDFFESVSKLETLKLVLKDYELNLTVSKKFWQLKSLKELNLCAPGINDNILMKISTSFTNLEILGIGKATATNEGVGSLATLKNLKRLSFYSVDNAHDDLNLGFERIAAACERLRKVFIWIKMQSTIVTSFVRYCPILRSLEIKKIEGIETIEDGLTMVGNFSRAIGRRNLTIKSYSITNKDILRVDEIQSEFDKLARRGKVIKMKFISD